MNEELANPFTRQIAQSWGQVFAEDMFKNLEKQTVNLVEALLKDIEESAPRGLADRTKLQGEAAMEVRTC